MADGNMKGMTQKWRMLLLAILPVSVFGAGAALMFLWGSDMLGIEMLLTENPFGALYHASHVLYSPAGTRGSGLYSVNLEDRLWFVAWASATLVLAVSGCTWLPLSNGTLFPAGIHKVKQPSTPSKTIAVTLIVLSFLAALLFLVVAWILLPLISDIGYNENVVWAGSEQRVGGIGPIFGYICVIILTALLLLPTFKAISALSLAKRAHLMSILQVKVD